MKAAVAKRAESCLLKSFSQSSIEASSHKRRVWSLMAGSEDREEERGKSSKGRHSPEEVTRVTHRSQTGSRQSPVPLPALVPLSFSVLLLHVPTCLLHLECLPVCPASFLGPERETMVRGESHPVLDASCLQCSMPKSVMSCSCMRVKCSKGSLLIPKMVACCLCIVCWNLSPVSGPESLLYMRACCRRGRIATTHAHTEKEITVLPQCSSRPQNSLLQSCPLVGRKAEREKMKAMYGTAQRSLCFCPEVSQPSPLFSKVF